MAGIRSITTIASYVMLNSHFLHNLADISMTYEAMVVMDLIPAIYDRPGRLAMTLDDEDESLAVILNQPYFEHPQTGRPTPLREGQRPPMMPQGAPLTPGQPPMPPVMPPGNGGPPMPPQAPPVKHYDLRKGSYGVSVDIGKSWQSRLEQEIGR